MGNQETSKFKKKIKKVFKKNEKIVERITCPFCDMSFLSEDPVLFNTHIRNCGIAKIKIKKACDLFPPSQDI